MNPDRRRLIISAAGVAVGGMATARLLSEEMLLRDRRLRRSRVAIIAAQEYSESLEGVLVSGLREFTSTCAESPCCSSRISWSTSPASR
jgi:hypothetical protein